MRNVITNLKGEHKTVDTALYLFRCYLKLCDLAFALCKLMNWNMSDMCDKPAGTGKHCTGHGIHSTECLLVLKIVSCIYFDLPIFGHTDYRILFLH